MAILRLELASLRREPAAPAFVALPQAVDRVAGRVVLLHKVVPHAGPVGGCENGGDVYRSAANLFKNLVRHVLVILHWHPAGLVFQMEQGNASRVLFQYSNRIMTGHA